MPYKISKVKGGYKATSPNHPQGFSKKPQTKKEAAIQKWIIEKNTGESDSGAKKPQAQAKPQIGVKRSK